MPRKAHLRPCVKCLLLSSFQNWNLNRNSQYQTAWTYSASEVVTCWQGRCLHMHAKTGIFYNILLGTHQIAQKRLYGHMREVVDLQELIWSFVPVT